MSSARRTALEVLARVEDDGAYANLALSPVLGRSDLDARDRAFVTDLVYGTLRRQRACDHLVDRFLTSDPPPAARRALRLGAYQLAYRDDIPNYAAVGETVAAAPRRFRGLLNAVLRKVASTPVQWPDDATRLSYPDWILESLSEDHGTERALEFLEAMNEPARTSVRDDGYVQDPASQMVVEVVGARPGELVADLCAAPGGKATGLAASGATVIAADVGLNRVGLVRANVERTAATGVQCLASDATQPALRQESFDRVLIDAPCSGLGVLRRRADARWRITASDVPRLAELQKRIVNATVPLVRPGGTFVYSVCTMTSAETLAIDEHLAATQPDLVPLAPEGGPWLPWGRGAMLSPAAGPGDGMCVFRYRREPFTPPAGAG